MKLVLLFILCFASLASAASATTVLAINSEPGEYVGQGKLYTLSSDDYTVTMSSYTVSGNAGPLASEFLTIDFNSKTKASDHWSLDIGTPPDGTILQSQTYTNASRFGVWIDGRPHLDLYGYGRGVNQGGLNSYFTIRELTRDTNNVITSAAIDLVQFDDAGVHSLTSSIRVNSTVPVWTAATPEPGKAMLITCGLIMVAMRRVKA